MSKVVKKAKKVIQKVIPKEIKPFVAPIAAYYLGPMALKGLGGAGLTGVKGFLARAAASGVTSAATQKLVEDDISKSSTLLSALSGGLGAGYGPNVGTQTAQGIRAAKTVPAYDFDKISMLDKAKNIGLEGVAKATEALTPTTGKGIAKLVGGTGMAASAEKNYELMQKELDEYNASLGASGVEDLGERRDLITKYMTNAGFDESQIQSALSRYGYLANGGRVGYKEGGTPMFNIQGSFSGNSNQEIMNTILEAKIPLNDKIKLLGDVGYFDGRFKFDKDVFKVDDLQKSLGMSYNEGKEGLSGFAKYNLDTNEPTFGLQYNKSFNDGGRVGYEMGGDVSYTDFGRSGVIYRDEKGNPITKEQFLEMTDEMEGIPSIRMKDKEEDDDKEPKTLEDLLEDPELIKQMLRQGMKDGGIMNLKGKEMDLRGGGFVPIGKKERADDVPARLSKNEFVMTANAVKGAGNGDINKGVKEMYKTMRMLEGRLA